ncbi:MAG: hypothetical protein COV07_00850 [Candidatus Vogelbacteria bacterium CG10_big_fil_rev_8_21_14_0_10_45_14]|uniref:TraC-like domain-containing protein n=1 Tax=Candidatus Vogelbacteria bacterium CG10_big_fil_rev_8_21_14_0_10_45_14 TaxID=1975042 RepID=A0A2H0RKW7_9BACT|nr:MAG: hypothetical protein COV07_00850 [Candidatus Vogelbacteria bacterium CG10_big_fil_rev_8_21_14_0_10_45_14]
MATNAAASQKFVPVREVRDGLVVLDDGSLRMVLMASSLNFALKNQDEQEGTILQFQNFLNSLDFSIELHIESRRLDIRPYLGILEERLHAQTNELLQIQTKEYINFIRHITDAANIMSKSFFVVVPYTPPFAPTKSGFLGGLFGGKKNATPATTFEESRSQLEQRSSVVEQGLIRCGVRVVALGTEELVELYYKIFNPGELSKAPSSEILGDGRKTAQ